MFKKILVTTDGSELAAKGVEAAAQLAQANNSTLFLTTVTNPLPGYGMPVSSEWLAAPGTLQDYSREMGKVAKEVLTESRKIIDKFNIEKVVEVHVEHQLASQGIIDAANKYEVDLIVIASHGRRGIKRMILGSQTQEVLSLSEIPVLVIK